MTSGAGTAELTVEGLPQEVRRAAELALEGKARGIMVLDLRGISSATDFFVIASGTSDVHVRAVADRVVEELKGESIRPAHVEGLNAGRWVLLDYIDFVVHVFHPESRSYYRLEDLWGDAPRVEVADLS